MPAAQHQAQVATITKNIKEIGLDQAAAAPPAREQREQRRGLIGADEGPREVDYREGKTGAQVVGSAGQPLDICSNFFEMRKNDQYKGLYQYNVQFSPEIGSSRFKSAMLHKIDGEIGNVRCFDGMTMFMPIELPEKKNVYTVSPDPKPDRPAETFTITIVLTNVVPINSPSTVQLMNIMFRRQLKIINMQLVGRNYYNPANAIDIPAHKMTIWPGFSTSILQYESGIMLCSDVSCKVLRTQTVLEFMYEIHNKSRNNFYDAAAKSLVGEIVLTRYNNKTYRVDDIDWKLNPTSTFTKEDGTSISYKEYLEGRYEIKITDLKQPLLVSRPKAKDMKRGMTGPLHLLPEHCAITGLSDEMRANFTIMKDLAVHTRISPTERVNQLQKFMGDLQNNAESAKELKDWNMEFAPKLLQMKGRNLGAEKMFQKNCNFSYKIEDADWSKETRGKQLIDAKQLEKWAVICTQRDQNTGSDFVETLKRVCGPMGMNVANPNVTMLQNDQARTYYQAIKDLMDKHGDMIQLICCIVPNDRKDRYDAIKKICCVEKPVPSQVVVSRTLSKKHMLMSVCTKIGIQLNCKLGGQIWAVEVPLKNVMVVGIDVYHDSLTKGKSIGGFVASLNNTLTSYFSTTTAQMSRTEMCDQLGTCMTAALRKYNEVNKQLPSKILIYRDGVGDGQLNEVKNHELPQIQKSLKEVAEGFDPKIAMIVVKKRISTR